MIPRIYLQKDLATNVMTPHCTPYYPFEPDRVYYQLRLTDQAASGIADYYMGQREDTTGEDTGDTVVTYVSERLARNIGSVAMYLDHSNANKPPMAIVFFAIGGNQAAT